MASLAETFFKLIILLLNFSVITFMVFVVVVLAFIIWRMIVTAKKIHEEDKKECGTKLKD